MTPKTTCDKINEDKNMKGVVNTEISLEMKKSYLDYAMSVIVSRAIPSIEDGLKPVQRRILHSMNLMGLKPNTSTKKSARIVGDVIGKFHPHGDSSVYEAMVRMAQNFSLRYPLVFGQGNFGCFSGDTKIALADGRNLNFKELIEEHNKGKRNFAFTINENLKIDIAEIKNPRKTKTNAEVINVILDNGEKIRCTPNHRFMLRDGSYKEAQYLKSGDSLMPCYLRLSTEKDISTPKLIGYKMIFQPKTDSWDFVHVLSDKWNLKNGIYKKSSGRIRHHVNFDKLDNNPSNIRRMPWNEHWKVHYNMLSEKHRTNADYRKKLSEGRKRFWSDKKNREDYSKRMQKRNIENWKKKSYREKMKKTLSEASKKFLEDHPERIDEIRIRASITMKKMWKDPYYRRLFNKKISSSNKKRKTNLTGKRKFLKICNYLLDNNLNINKENYENTRKKIFKTKSFTSWDLGLRKYFEDNKNLVLCELNGNHRVVRVEFINENEDVYDLEVPETHNFALASGIFVHNSIDGDPAAAYRYTEAKLMPISYELLQDIDKETVKFVSNYDNSLKEPELLPGKLPNLILNGATGIAVGMATSIPPHNLNEISDAIIAYIKKPEIELKELCEIVKGPDFPTGGSVQGDMEELYKTGRGRLILRGKTSIEKIKNKDAIIITEIPYMLNKATLVTQIANLVQLKKIKNVSDLRDESSKGKIRIVLELKKGANPKFVINALYKYTRLQDSFNSNFLALVGRQPKVLNLKDIVKEYVEYRKKVITKRVQYELKKAKDRQEIVEGLLIALKNIDDIIKLIKKAKTASEASEELIKKYKLTKKQSQAVLDTKLQQLTSLETDKLKKEAEELKIKIQEYEKILGNINEILKIIVKEVNELKTKYGDNRKTNVLKKISDISEKDLVQEREVVVTITEKGYCKRMDLQTYREQKRGGRGVIGSSLSTDDFVKKLITCSTHDYLMFFTTRGRVLWLKAYDLPSAERYSKGKAIVNMLNLKNESITNVLSVKNFEDYLFMATKKGIVKKISLRNFSKPRASGVKAINLPNDDSDFLIGIKVVKESDDILLATKKGQAIRFSSDNVRAMGRASYGVTGIKLAKNDEVVSLEVLNTDAIMTIARKGFGKRTYVNDYRKTARAGKGVINLKISEKTGDIVTTVAVNDNDNIIITTAKGIIIRTSLKNIRIMGRATQGVRVVKIQKGDYVTDLIRVQENGVNGE